MDTYFSYLKEAYNQVVHHCLADESLQVLAELENKDYFALRLHELFTQIYSGQRETKIQQLIRQLQQLKLANATHTINQQQAIQSLDYVKQCRKCQAQELQPIQAKANIVQLISQNEKLSLQIRKLKQKEVEEIQSLARLHKTNQTKLSAKLQTISEQNRQLKDNLKMLNEKLKLQTEKVQKSEELFLSEKEKEIKIILRQRELQKSIENLEFINQKLVNQLSSLKQNKSILEDKVRKSEENAKFLTQKLQAYEKQINLLDNAKIRLSNSKAQPEISHQQSQLSKLNSLISTITFKQLQIGRIMQEKRVIEQENSRISKELSQFKVQTEKIITQLKQGMSRNHLQYQRELKVFREREINYQVEKREDEVQAKMEELSQLKQIVDKLKSEKVKSEAKIVRLEHSNQVLTQNYSQLNNAINKQRQRYEQKCEQYEERLQAYRKLEKELQHRSKLINGQGHSMLVNQMTEKVRYYQDKLEIVEQQLERKKKSEEKLSKRLFGKQIQTKYQTLQAQNQRLLLKQHELSLKLNDTANQMKLQSVAHKQLIEKKQQKIRSLKKLNEQLTCKNIQLVQEFQSLRKEKINYEKELRAKQTALKKQQQKFIIAQQKNRQALVEMMKSQQSKQKQLNEQYQRFYCTISRNKEGGGQTKVPGTIKQLEKEYQVKIKQLQNEADEMKKRNRLLEQRLRESTASLSHCKQQLSKAEQQLKETQQRQHNSQVLIQEQKDRALRIVKQYENKIKNHKLLFKQFKVEICSQFAEAVLSIKLENISLKKQISGLVQNYHKVIFRFKSEIQEKISYFQASTDKFYMLQSTRKNEEVITKLDKKYEQTVQNYESKLKQKQMDLMTIVAEKQYIIEQIKQKQVCLAKQNKQLQSNYNKVLAKNQKNEGIVSQLKAIVTKMQGKVDEAQKNLMIKEREVIQMEKIIKDVTDKMKKSEEYYRQQMIQCRQKYKEENQRMFNRFERQFNKVVSINTVKSKEKLNALGISSSKANQAPTKGGDEDKIARLKKQIQEQKKVVEQLEKHKKI